MTPDASLVRSDTLLSADGAGDLWRRWRGVVASSDALLNEATSISSYSDRARLLHTSVEGRGWVGGWGWVGGCGVNRIHSRNVESAVL